MFEFHTEVRSGMGEGVPQETNTMLRFIGGHVRKLHLYNSL